MAEAQQMLQQLQHSFAQMSIATYLNLFNDLEPFAGLPTDNIDDWLNRFRSITNLGVPEATAARILKLKLKGDARVFAESLDEVALADLEILQTRLTETFHSPVHVAAARTQLRQEKFRVDDTPSSLFNRLKPLVSKIHFAATAAEKDAQLKQYLWERLPDQVVLMSTGHTFADAAALRNFATQLLQTMQQRPAPMVSTMYADNSQGDLFRKLEDLTQQVQHMAAVQQKSQADLNPQPTSGAPTIFKSRKARQVVQRTTSQLCKACGKNGHATKHCVRCSACEQLGHVARFCPFNAQRYTERRPRDSRFRGADSSQADYRPRFDGNRRRRSPSDDNYDVRYMRDSQRYSRDAERNSRNNNPGSIIPH